MGFVGRNYLLRSTSEYHPVPSVEPNLIRGAKPIFTTTLKYPEDLATKTPFVAQNREPWGYTKATHRKMIWLDLPPGPSASLCTGNRRDVYTFFVHNGKSLNIFSFMGLIFMGLIFAPDGLLSSFHIAYP